MFIPIKQIILENKFFDNIAQGKRNTSLGGYTQKDFQKDKNVAKFGAIAGGLGGAVVGGVTDGLIDGDTTNPDGTIEHEGTGNGLVGGALLGVGAVTGYGLNNNHKVITKDRVQSATNYASQKVKPVSGYARTFIDNVKQRLNKGSN